MTHNRRAVTRWFADFRKRHLLLTMLAAACALALSASVAAAGNASREVQKFTVSPDSLCGFSGSSYWVFNLTGAPTGSGSFIQPGSIVQTFIADNGRGVKISWGDGVFISGPTVFYADGSSSFTAMEDGLDAKVQALGGSLLEQSTGRVTITYYFDANDNFIDAVIDSTSGPQNNDSGFPDCSVIGPYLASGLTGK